MQREIQLTADGSHTISIPEMKVAYHSRHGAIGESVHVYIQGGLLSIISQRMHQPIRILEIGFGTGLNALLSLQQAILQKQPIHYTAIEPFPLSEEEVSLINHGHLLSMQAAFLVLHNAHWEKDIWINEWFTLKKMKVPLLQLTNVDGIQVIYFDAFAPTVQPELWTQAIFEKMYDCLAPGGLLLTYCSKSDVRRAMTAAGFRIEKNPGPWGKREMVSAWKK